VVVIASSDSDFAPLVSRLREKGCRVVGVGQDGKTGDETRTIYDDYEVLTHRRGSAAPLDAAPAPTPRSRPAKKAPAPRKTPSRKAAPKPAPAPPPPAPPLNDTTRAIFETLPALAAGETIELRVAAERLRDARLLSNRGSSTKLFGQYPTLFELLPDKQPNRVRLRVAAT
jgi:NYN domain